MENVNPACSSDKMPDKTSNNIVATNKKHIYKKRPGTSGVTGQLYETKLLSLILFRAHKDDEVNDFYLGTNLNEIGAFDDICFKFQLHKKSVVAFIQAKHRDDPRKGGITDVDLKSSKSDFSLQKYFDSYLKIKQKFKNNECCDDMMFTGEFENTEFCFIIYTPAVNKISKKKRLEPYSKDSIHSLKIKDLISTSAGADIFQIDYDESDINTLSNILLEEQLDVVVGALLKCVTPSESKLCKKTFEVLSKYQSFLIPDVLQICEEDTSEHPKAKINPQFFYSNDFFIIKLREKLFTGILNKSAYNEDEAHGALRALIYDDGYISDSVDLKNIIGNVLVYDKKTNKLELSETAPEKFHKYKKDIHNIQISQAKVNEAHHEAGKQKLLSMAFDLPEGLGVNDLNKKKGKKKFDEERNFAIEFLDKLYFYTKEGKQDEVEKVLKKEINKYNDNIERLYRLHSEALFLKLHDKVQKWSMLQGNAYYLTNDCDVIKKSQCEVIDSPYLTTLNFNSTNELNKYDIGFKSEVIVHKLGLDNLPFRVTYVVTRVKILTCIKLIQCFTEEKCLFISLEFIKNLRAHEMEQFLDEVRTAQVDVLVVIHNEFDENDVLHHIIVNFLNTVIVVTDEILPTSNHKVDFNVVIDKDNTLASLDQESQDRILAYDKITIQGETVSLGRILINEECKDLITEEIIYMVLKNENFSIGKALADEKYVSMKDYYLPRYLKNDYFESTFKVNNLLDIKSTVVVITAEPGMGKSTLITHMSLETKRNNPNCWIVRINLLDHCSQFFTWQKERRDINLIDTMTLICKAELGNVSENFKLEVKEGVLALTSCNIKGSALLHLNLIIQCYNKDNIIFLFDGFDEICPHYKKEVIKFIKNVTPMNQNQYETDEDSLYVDIRTVNGEFSEEDMFFQKFYKGYDDNCLRRVWIASRPYNSITQTLKDEFGIPFKLKPLSHRDQAIYYQKYFHANLKLHKLSKDQFNNIEGFFEFMSQYRRNYGQDHKVLHITSIPLNNMYEAAVDHFRNDILDAPIDVDKEKLRSEWVSSKQLLSVLERCNGNLSELSRASTLAGIPLHMYVAANCFVNEVKDTIKKDLHEKWDLNVNTFDYYTHFLETKFKSIRLEEKNRRYTDCPDERLEYEKQKREFIEGHKKLAFYAMFYENKYYRNVVTRKELSGIKEMIRKIKRGEEKTGLIHRIHNNVPMFIHLAFAEYFAIEFFTDKLKTAKNDKKHQILYFLVNNLLLDDKKGLLTVLNHKIKYDEGLKKILSDPETKRIVFNFLLEQNDMTEWTIYGSDEPYEKKIESALNNVVSTGLTELTMFLLSPLEDNLNKDNIETFIELITDKFFIAAALVNEDKVISFVLDQFKSLDSTILNPILKYSKLRKFLSSSGTMRSNEDILKLLHSHVEHLTTPYWYFDHEDQQIHKFYFNDSL